jgi:ABC-type uncharacterized transport system substrate-binding protein
MWPALKRLASGIFLILLASGVLLVSDWGRRRPSASPIRRVAILQHASQPALDSGVEGMIAGLAQGGFADGRNISIRRYNAENDVATGNVIAKGITNGEYALVLTASTVSLQAVANANRDGRTMHVFGLVSDPYAAGVGVSRENPLDHPPHLVGFATMQPVAQAFELARRLLPSLRAVGTVWNPAEANSEAQLAIARAACAKLGIELRETTVDSTAGVLEAAGAVASRDVQAIWIPGDVMVLSAVDAVVGVARRAAIPVFTSIPGNARRGTLFDLGADYHEVGRLAGELAARILAGTDPATIPVENVLPQALLLNRAALAGLKDPWQVPDDVLRTAQLVGEAQQAAASKPLAKKWNVDILEYVDVADVEEAEKGVRAGLRDAGLVEGRDYSVRVRNAQGDMPTLSTLVDAALSDTTDLLVTLSTPTLQAALRRAREVPIVFTFVADAIAAGAGRSNTDHLPNVTGVPTTGAYGELLDIVRACLPAARRIGTLFVPAEVNSVYNKEKLEQAAERRGFELAAVAANTSAEVPDATLALLAQNIDAICQVGGNLTSSGFASIVQPARRARVPVFGFLTADSEGGAVVAAARDYYEGGRDAGRMAARIMRGENPASIPFQPLVKTRVLVRRDAARAVGLTIPPAVLEKAAEVVGE